MTTCCGSCESVDGDEVDEPLDRAELALNDGQNSAAMEALKTARAAVKAPGWPVYLLEARTAMALEVESTAEESLEAALQAQPGLCDALGMRYGLARGLYANEAGYGTAAVAYGTARSQEPLHQGLNAVMETFIVSFVTSTISAMTILLTGAYVSGQTSTAAVALAFDAAMPSAGGLIVAFCVFLFGYTTLIGWSYYGEKFLEYWLGPRVVMPYRWIYCLLIPFGAVSKVDVVWAWGDLMNALQVFPNMIGLIGLSGLVAATLAGRRAQADPPATRA